MRYHMGIGRKAAESTMSDASERRDVRHDENLGCMLSDIASWFFQNEVGIDLKLPAPLPE